MKFYMSLKLIQETKSGLFQGNFETVIYEKNNSTASNFQNLQAQISTDINDYAIDTISIGDLNNDKIVDFAYIKGTKFSDETNQWDDCLKIGCLVTVSFSCGLPDITFENAVTASIENIGDIDGDGFDEIVIAPSWIIGCWGRLHFYTYKKGKWKKWVLWNKIFATTKVFDINKEKR